MVEKKRRSSQSMGSRMWKRKSRRTTVKKRFTTNVNEIPGLIRVRMSPSLQSALSCRIGINITSSERWMYIYKQKLLDEIQNRQSNIDSQFLEIQAEIQTFPDDYILIGSYGDNNFLLCLSEYAKNVCENWKEEEKKQLMKRLHQFLYRDSCEWKTLGSDKEIDRVICNRSPFCVELIRQSHLNVKFDVRLVKDAKDGYAEFVNTRATFNILYRRRLDRAVQASKRMMDQATQTINPPRFNRGIQYCYTYAEVKTTKVQQLQLDDWFAQNYSDLSSSIRYNAHINIYTNDYMDLPNQKTRYTIENPNLIMSFHDCITCHNKLVTCIAWNAQMSGIIAAAYARFCPKAIKKEPTVYQTNPRKEMDTNLVLIWSVTQPTKPLLYLHAPREITALNFCPYQGNILAGGCSDGQIILWDMSGKLDGQKTERPIQATEVVVLIREKMAWMKYPPGEQNIFPCIESKIETCHKTHVTVIKWLPPEYELNILGEFVKCPENERHMQFLTTAVGDSTMLVWDLKPKKIYPVPKKKKQRKKLTSRPKTLDATKSPFSKLNSNFEPVFQLNFVDLKTKRPMHINDFSFKMGIFSYVAVNPETTNNVLEKTKFIRDGNSENLVLEKNFLAATEFGQLYHCSWTAFDYDRGLKINMQDIETISCKPYHDGPINHMQRSPFCADLILTTGGRVFAIWDNIGDDIKSPLIWRKATNRYVMAVWSLQNSASIIAAREDGKIELWDFDEDTKFPLRLTKLIGDTLLSLFVNNSLSHVTKGTCITTDLTGILSIYDISSKLFVHNEESQLRKNAQHIYNQRRTLKFWSEYVTKKMGQIDESQDCPTETQGQASRKQTLRFSIEIKRMSFEVKRSAENIWQEKEYKRMYKILINRHKLNLDNIAKNKGSLDKLLESRSARLRNIDRVIKNKEKIFQEEKTQVTAHDKFTKRKRITVHFPKELVKAMKEQYFENYKITETEALTYIKSNRYYFAFEWKEMICEAKKRYNGDSESSSNVFKATPFSVKQYMSIIPTNVNRRSTKILMTQIALLASISGKN